MSSRQARLYHSITIGKMNTWDDWHLVPTSRPLVVPPPVKTHFIEIPGRDGVLELSQAIYGKPLYSNRSGSWEFMILQPWDVQKCFEPEEWYERYSTIMNYIHGKELDVILDDEPDFYYTGRLSVESWSSQKDWSTITINYNFEPYKKEIGSSAARWLWDPFVFGTETSYANIQVSGSRTVDYIEEAGLTIPVIDCSAANMTVTYNNTTHNLSEGRNIVSAISMQPGVNTFVFGGTGKVTIFETDKIMTYKNMKVNGTLTVTYDAVAELSTPVFNCTTANITVEFNEVVYNLKKGTNEVSAIHMGPGENTFIFRGTGKVTLEVIGGMI